MYLEKKNIIDKKEISDAKEWNCWKELLQSLWR